MNIKRILVFALAMLVMAMPVGLAEGGYGALTLSNFHLDLGMGEPIDIDASLKLGVGGELPDGPGRLDVEVTGGGQTAFTGSAAFDKDTLRAILGGASFYYEVPVKDLEAMASATGELPSGGNMSPADMQKIGDLINRYITQVQKYSDTEYAAKFGLQILSALNIEEKGKEQTDLFGESMELYRYDLSMAGDDIGKLYDAMFKADPEMKSLMMDYFTLIGDATGEEVPFDVENFGDSFTAMLKEAGVEIAIDMSVWTDAATMTATEAKAVKEVINISVTGPKTDVNLDPTATPEPSAEPETITIQIPVTVSVLESDAGTRITYDLNVSPEEGESLVLAFDATLEAPAADGGTTGEGALTLDFSSKDESAAFKATVTCKNATDKDGVSDFSFAIGGEGEGQKFDLNFAYDGTSATETEKAGVVTIDFNIPADGAATAGSFKCDTLLETGAFTALGDADFAGLTKVNPLTADEATQTQVETEMSGIMMQAMGVLMQTPGLSNIMGGMMNAG